MPLSESPGINDVVDLDFASRTNGGDATCILSGCEAAAAAAAAAALAAAPWEGSLGRNGGYELT